MNFTATSVMLRVEAAYAMPDEQIIIRLELKEGSTVHDVLEQSELLQRYPEINATDSAIGIYGRVVPLDHPIRDGDRVEIYRPLTIDPKIERRSRSRRSA